MIQNKTKDYKQFASEKKETSQKNEWYIDKNIGTFEIQGSRVYLWVMSSICEGIGSQPSSDSATKEGKGWTLWQMTTQSDFFHSVIPGNRCWAMYGQYAIGPVG